MFFPPLPGTHFASFSAPPGTPKAGKMRWRSVPGLSKFIFGQIAYFVASANKKHTSCILQIIKNHKESFKNASNASARKKEGLQSWLFVIFDDFDGPQGGWRIMKDQKKGLPKIDQKKGKKKRRYVARSWWGAAVLAQPWESKIPIRKALAKSGTVI